MRINKWREESFYIYLIVCLTTNTVFQAKLCRNGFVEIETWCVFFHLEPKSLELSEDICKNMGGEIIFLDSKEKQDALTRYMEEKGFYDYRLDKMLMQDSYYWLINIDHKRDKMCKDYESRKKDTTIDFIDIPNGKIPVDSCAEDRANYTTPPGFTIKLSSIPHGGLGVWTNKDVPKFTVLAVYEGEEHLDEDRDLSYSWVVKHPDGFTYYIDAISPATSNWIRYVNSPRNEEEENVHYVLCHGLIYYMTSKDVAADTELMVWYGETYGHELGVFRNHPDFHLDFENMFYVRVSPLNLQSYTDNEDEREKEEEEDSEYGVGVLLEFDGLQWNRIIEKNYSYFAGHGGIQLPFICEQTSD